VTTQAVFLGMYKNCGAMARKGGVGKDVKEKKVTATAMNWDPGKVRLTEEGRHRKVKPQERGGR